MTTYYHAASARHLSEGNPFTLGDVQYPANWLNLSTAQDKLDLGLEEVITVGTPEDSRYFWVSDILVGAVRTIINTPKDPEVVAAIKLSAINARVAQLERETLLPRATREFMLLFLESSIPAESLDTNFGYQRVKALDLKIKAVREGTWAESTGEEN